MHNGGAAQLFACDLWKPERVVVPTCPQISFIYFHSLNNLGYLSNIILFYSVFSLFVFELEGKTLP